MWPAVDTQARPLPAVSRLHRLSRREKPGHDNIDRGCGCSGNARRTLPGLQLKSGDQAWTLRRVHRMFALSGMQIYQTRIDRCGLSTGGMQRGNDRQEIEAWK